MLATREFLRDGISYSVVHFGSLSADHEMVFHETAPRPGHTLTLSGLEPYISNRLELPPAGLRKLDCRTWDAALSSSNGVPFPCVPETFCHS